jgi:hypothetical protein
LLSGFPLVGRNIEEATDIQSSWKVKPQNTHNFVFSQETIEMAEKGDSDYNVPLIPLNLLNFRTAQNARRSKTTASMYKMMYKIRVPKAAR